MAGDDAGIPVIVTDPGATAVTLPEPSTVATAALEEDHVTDSKCRLSTTSSSMGDVKIAYSASYAVPLATMNF
jgi:hypothetical protein